MSQDEIDGRNHAFWDELCGSGMAKALGITDASPESLRKFDDAYLGFYPYLLKYLAPPADRSHRVLEIGLGYGTLGGELVDRGFDYYGLDIAAGPAAMTADRASRSGLPASNVQQGSALAIPHADEFFDEVYSIGCLHHTGDLKACVAEVHRVLAPGGRAVVMLYNRLSYRQLVQAPANRVREIRSEGLRGYRERVRAMYDTNAAGEAAPHTDYTSVVGVRRLFRQFGSVKTEIQNFDHLTLFGGRKHWDRPQLLGNVGRVLGLDLYIVATKKPEKRARA